MRLTRLPPIAIIAAAGVSFLWVGMSTWEGTRTGLLTALSVIAAAALVRLARGLPFTNPDHFDAAEVEKVVAAVKQLGRSLRVFLGVTLGTMVMLVMTQPIQGLLGRLAQPGPQTVLADRVLSALIGAALAYVLARMWQIVGSDISLLEKQGTFMIRAVHRKERKKDEDADAKSEAPPFKAPEGYGKRLQ